MNSNQSLPDNLPNNFFDSDKKSKKEQHDEISKALEGWEKEIEACDAEVKQQVEDELEMQQNDKNIDELDQQLEQWKRFAGLEKKAEELQNRMVCKDASLSTTGEDSKNSDLGEDEDVIDDDIEDRLFDWRSKSL